MKIGIVATNMWGTVFLDNAREMARLGHDVAVYTDDARARGARRFTRIAEDGIDFYVINPLDRDPLAWLPDKLFKRWLGRRFFTTLLAILRFFRATRDRDVYLVESDWMGLFVALASKLMKFRWVVGVHDTDHLRIALSYPGRPQSPLLQRAKLWVLTRCDAVRANSVVTRDALVQGGCPPAKIEVIPLHIPSWMWVEGELEAFRAAARRDVYMRHGLADDASLLITMCRLVPVKGLEMAIETLAAMQGTQPDARLMICGGDRQVPGLGSYSAALRALAARLGVEQRVIFTGNIDIHEVKRYLAAADLHLAPSLMDTFNYGVIEAGLAGTPSLASDAVGAGPWMSDAGAGIVLSDRSAQAWATAANGMLERPQSPAERLAAAAQLASTLHPAVITQQIVDLLARAAARQG